MHKNIVARGGDIVALSAPNIPIEIPYLPGSSLVDS